MYQGIICHQLTKVETQDFASQTNNIFIIKIGKVVITANCNLKTKNNLEDWLLRLFK